MRSPLIMSRALASPLIVGGSVPGAVAATPFTTDWKSAGTGANDDSAGDVAWSNPGNITASDDSDAQAVPLGNGDTTQILRATNFGFTTGDVPNGATILGIEVGIEVDITSNVVDFVASLRTSSGQVGDNKATGAALPTTDMEVTYGGESDDWNAGLTDSDIRDAGFGFDFQAEAQAGPVGINVDHIRIRVHGTA